MSRFGGAFWFVLVIASGVTNFVVKKNVQNLDDQLAHVRHKTVDEQKKIHELTADWTFLNQPELLADLNNRYVHLGPLSPKQVESSLDKIPLRPAPPPQDAAPQIASAAPTPPTAPPPTPQAAAPVPAAAPARAPIVPVSATVPAPVRAQSTPAAHPASLDALFAQAAGDR
jgi:hypothetical protein